MKTIVLIGLMTLLTLPVFGQDAAEPNETNYDEAIALVEVWLDAMQRYDELPGISAIALKDQDVIWEGAYGMANPAENLAMEPNTICSVCSISKLFTSISIMNLYEEGKLRLDDEIQDVLPGYDLPQQYGLSGPITIRNLLTHSSGLPRENAWSHWTEDDVPFPTREQIMNTLVDQQTLYPSSTYFQYSNLAMTLLGFIVEEISGQSYEAYVNETILNPLNLSDTRADMPEDLWGEQLAIGHAMEDLDGNQPPVPFFDGNGVTPAAGFSSTVQDLATFAAWQFRLYDAEEEDILRPSTLKNMHNIHWMDSDFGTSWGLGFSVYKGPDGKKWVGHGGHCPGYKTTLALIPETKMAYSVMINSSNPNPSKYLRGIHGIFEKAASIDTTDTEHLDELKEYVGVFRGNGMGGYTYYGTWGDKLVSIGLRTGDPGESMTMYRRVDKDHFVRIRDNGEDGENMQFIRNEDGEVVRMKYYDNYISEKVLI
jgi:CubicO group peptidase (beta-lactamase class C family)